ncbi:hypothetical protein A3C34_03130 [Candidatus Amesbacteria bacterium RIFCSPHIGHO2_02_FULL_48_21]|uniref:Trigger factor n=1 Tax=Candidatus Amesbacteria bacterium GW2011_GWA1_48_9 TaxID=1618355 RepID=A0A0G1V1N1_9BACT|nr:MAG: Trigger factor [Candidatus Amesbacteria bacterium GW2011_GWA1_48_9]OGC90602.1 MAG: hypothetical protein A2V48_01605 [Candidatus Amesbacteria bacterium RBG_19FT_COMBO_48_16]OGC97342.1 MAG: hypothetical protein A3C34_03130 [Candidatus Amesbacteria bacterium RIFCSPHIGHO2_02_FULL_48_21]OGC98679.1 MAG: hypothetical protein A2702_01990 [Candidatus Amesbacteria bacterium RIFCSPHIGHO2_01_FULL_48_75]OGD06522.1 MAG: hypothetical protein A3B58_02580 [Candidatus Amesbacteria bacterium RIFCSPLOWO2_0
MPPPASTLTRLENGTLEIRLTLPWPEIQSALEKEVLAAIKTARLPGFRPGSAPRHLVEPRLDRARLLSQAVQKLLPQIYSRAVTDHQLKPALLPHLHIDSGNVGQDWQITATTCEAPIVNLNLPTKPPKTIKQLNGFLDYLRQKTALKIPDLLVEEEANHRLSSLAENLTRLGLTPESYLATKKMRPEDLKSELTRQSRTDLETEFILSHIQTRAKLQDRKATLDFLQNLL